VCLYVHLIVARQRSGARGMNTRNSRRIVGGVIFYTVRVVSKENLLVCLCIPLSFLDNSLEHTFPRQRKIVGGVVFYATCFVSNESRRLVLPRTYSKNCEFLFVANYLNSETGSMNEPLIVFLAIQYPFLTVTLILLSISFLVRSVRKVAKEPPLSFGTSVWGNSRPSAEASRKFCTGEVHQISVEVQFRFKSDNSDGHCIRIYIGFERILSLILMCVCIYIYIYIYMK
jgi:hypothetical protein